MKPSKIITLIIFIGCFLTSVPGQKIVRQKEPEKKTRKVYSVERAEQIFSLFEGKWDWEYLEKSCRENPFTLSFSDNQKELYLTYENSKTADGKREKRVYTYNLLAISLYGIRGQIEGEKRLTADGRPVSWEFILLSKDEFCWHRADLALGTCTRKIVRCKD